MAKSCGIHIDQRSVHLVALDGNAKKHKVIASVSRELDPHEDPGEMLVRFLKEEAKNHKLSTENVALVVDSGPASFRSLTLPFDDRTKIEEVLKYEVEGDLPQWDIDEVVTDFIVSSSQPGVSSDLIVTAMPKDRLMIPLEACERAGLEADEAELDGTALFNAAIDSGVLSEESSQLLVHVGDHSTVVVVADGNKLVSMRTIRAGGIAPTKPFAGSDDDEEGEEEAEAANQAVSEQTSKRIQREIVRTISAAKLDQPLEYIHTSGHALPGFSSSGLFEVPVVSLKILPAGATQPLDTSSVIAYGGALRALGGGVLRPHLRREELRFTGTFERLELPMAVFSLLLFFLLLVMFVVTDIQLKWRETGDPKNDVKGDMQIWASVSNSYMLPDPGIGHPGRLENPPDAIATYAARMNSGEITDRSNYQQLNVLNRMLVGEIDRLERELGRKSEITPPQSALHGSALVMEVLAGLGDQAPRYAVRRMEANYVPGRNGKDDYVTVKLDLDFLAQDALTATKHYTNFANAVQQEVWCTDFERKPTKELDSGEGIYIDGVTIKVDVSKAIDSEGEFLQEGKA